jgi:hypothetical protein
MFIKDPLDFLPIPDPGSRGQKGAAFGSVFSTLEGLMGSVSKEGGGGA